MGELTPKTLGVKNIEEAMDSNKLQVHLKTIPGVKKGPDATIMLSKSGIDVKGLH